jgi:hypothetical protein
MIDITGIPILAERLAKAQKSAEGEQKGAGLHNTHDPIERAMQELLGALTVIDAVIEKKRDTDVALERIREALDELRANAERAACGAL